jgi:hypothetical protein
MDALRQPEIKELIHQSYQLVLEKLPKKLQMELEQKSMKATGNAKKKVRRATAK